MKQLRFKTFCVSLLLMAPATGSFSANSDDHARHVSPYSHETDRAVKSLSAEDIDELRRGGGWGLARAAELNGMPGPLHLLEMKDEIELSAEQEAAIEGIFRKMKAAATDKGKEMIDAETELDQRFSNANIDAESLNKLVTEIARIRGELRLIHLSAHLETLPVLTGDQIARYNQLRGYSEADPCNNVPEGHNEAMWRKHNGCN